MAVFLIDLAAFVELESYLQAIVFQEELGQLVFVLVESNELGGVL